MTKDLSVTLLKVSDVMEMLSCSRATVYRMIEDQKLERVYPRAGMPRITGSSYLDYLEETKTGNARATKPSSLPTVPKRPGAGAASTVLNWLGLKP